jgi:CO/xanthine dehydrogenase Mo-binding subunit
MSLAYGVQEWNDKHSDDALTRICLYGIGAHRVEVECQDGQKFYVVRRHWFYAAPGVV